MTRTRPDYILIAALRAEGECREGAEDEQERENCEASHGKSHASEAAKERSKVTLSMTSGAKSCDIFHLPPHRLSDTTTMDEYIFNVDNGYLEGLVRGFRSGILSRGDYLNSVQCETVEGTFVP